MLLLQDRIGTYAANRMGPAGPLIEPRLDYDPTDYGLPKKSAFKTPGLGPGGFAPADAGLDKAVSGFASGTGGLATDDALGLTGYGVPKVTQPFSQGRMAGPMAGQDQNATLIGHVGNMLSQLLKHYQTQRFPMDEKPSFDPIPAERGRGGNTWDYGGTPKDQNQFRDAYYFERYGSDSTRESRNRL